MFNQQQFIKSLVDLGERQLDGEQQALELIKASLKKLALSYVEQRFSLDIPVSTGVNLIVDKREVSGIESCSLRGGQIDGKANLLSSLISSQKTIDLPNLNFNPSCAVASRSNHYHAPALALSPEALDVVLKGQEVSASIEVVNVPHQSANLLVGDQNNPRKIIFVHYDSIGPGAIDNASGVALLLGLLSKNPEILKDNLFVFSGAEELSLDYPIYWGHGFRVFEMESQKLFDQASGILVVDCIGNGPAELISDSKYLKLGFPIKNIEALSTKISMLSADFEQLMTVYHSQLDDGRGLEEKYLDEAMSKLEHYLASQ